VDELRWLALQGLSQQALAARGSGEVGACSDACLMDSSWLAAAGMAISCVISIGRWLDVVQVCC
jgi:hypothetical protein